jgi:hypothetical protein
LAVSKESKMGLTTAGRKRPEIKGRKRKESSAPRMNQFDRYNGCTNKHIHKSQPIHKPDITSNIFAEDKSKSPDNL